MNLKIELSESNHRNELGDRATDASEVNALDLRSIFPDDGARSAFLSSARQEMYDALKLFHDHVKYSLRMMLTVFTVVFAILGLVLRGSAPLSFDPKVILILGGLILVLTGPLGIISTYVISRYYELYVAALIYAAELHEAEGLGSHVWFQRIEDDREYLRKKLGRDDVPQDLLVKRRTRGWPHSWILYTLLIGLIAVVGVVAGATIAVSAWFDFFAIQAAQPNSAVGP